MSLLLTICMLHFVAQLSPGPDVLLIAKSSASTTRANTLKIISGISAGIVVWVALTLMGFTVLILIPPVQNALKATMMKVMMKRQQAMMEKMMGGMMGDMGGAQGQNPFADMMRQMQDMQNQQGGRDSSIIDGEAREVVPEAKQIELKDVNQR